MSGILDAELTARIGHLRVTSRALADSVLAGSHPTRRVGSSIDFAEHREYRPGDDPRTLDPRVHARTDRDVVRRFQHEAEIRALVALDTSGSMRFASDPGLPTKRDHAARILLGLAYLLLRQGDRVAALDLANAERAFVPHATGMTQLERIEDLFSATDGPEKMSLRAALSVVGSQVTRRSLVVVASDLLDDDRAAIDELAMLRAAGHAVIVLQVADPLELEFDVDGAFEFVGTEGEGTVIADATVVRDAYLRELRAFLETTRATCEAAGVRLRVCPTHEPVESILAALLEAGEVA